MPVEVPMSEFTRKMESIARDGLRSTFEQLQSIDQRLGIRERVERFREDVSRTQRLLMDGAQTGGMEHLRNVRVWYARLEVEYGADVDTVTRSYRRLVKLYHPDLYVANADHAAMATEVTQGLVTAYNGLLRHLQPNGR